MRVCGVRSRNVLVGLVALAWLTGCVAATRSRAWLETSTTERTRHRLGPRSLDAAHPLPPNASASDGVDPDEAVAIALWRSPALQAELTNLDSALADFDEARRPPNPRLSFLAPIDPRQLALLLAWPIEAIWQVPFRTKAANRELERVAESLVQIVLNLERDVRLAHADARLARARVEVLEAAATAWRDAARVAESRAGAGEVAPAEATPVQAEASIAADAVTRARRETEIADARLLALLGAPWTELPSLSPPMSRQRELPSRDVLVAQALRQRPDLRAAEFAIHAAAARGRWERARVFSLVATLDGQAPRGELVPNFSAGVQLELPIFSQNQGGIGRADAAVARAGYLYAAARLTVSMEVTTTRAATERAKASLAAYESVLRALAEASRGARHAFENGAESYLVVIDALRREADARLRRIELDAELARAEAELSRAVGGSVGMEAP
ncbi:MAG: TolC family protein [Myxococcaceae bacterium]